MWSPDSARLAFIALTGDHEYALYVANVDSTELQELMLINTGDESGEMIPAAPLLGAAGASVYGHISWLQIPAFTEIPHAGYHRHHEE